MRFNRRVLFGCCLVLCAMSLLASSARASNPLSMQVSSTLAKTGKPLSIQTRVGRWFPVAVTLSNTGDAVKGRLELRLTSTSGDARDASFYADVDLPANQSNKRVWLYGRADSSGFDGATITFSGANFKTMREAFTLVPIDEGVRLVLTISDSDEKLTYLSSLPDKRLGIASELQQMGNVGQSGMRTGFVSPLGASHDLIPDRWIGLEAADMIVLQDFPHTALSPEQLAAVRGYVAGGGALLVTGGADWQRLSSSPLADLWPLVPNSSGAASPNEVSNLAVRYTQKLKNISGADRLGGAPVVVSRGNLRPDSVVRGNMSSGLYQGGHPIPRAPDELVITKAKNEPILASRDVGAGRVLFLAMDPTKPPFLGWRGLNGLWAEIFANTRAARRLEAVRDEMNGGGYGSYNSYNRYRTVSSDSTSSMLSVIRRLPQLRTPPTSTIAWFLAFYVFCLVPLNYFVLRGFDKRELAWVTVPVIAVLFSLASYAAARRIKGVELLSRHINIVQGTAGENEAGSGLARADAMLWFYSPRKTSYDISSDNAQMAMGDYLGQEDSEPGNSTANANALAVLQPDASRAFRVENSDVKMWDEAKFIGESTLGVGRGVQVRKTASGGGFNARNDSPFDLRAAVLVTSDGRVLPLGDLKAGASVSINAPLKTKSAKSKSTTQGGLPARIEAAARLAPLFDQPDVKNGATTSDNGSASTLRLLARSALPAAIGEAKSGSQPMLVAWSTQPVAALRIENETPRAQNVTLFVFRLPRGG